MHRNNVIIGGVIVNLVTPRYTPAGILIAEFKVNHSSSQVEAGHLRKIEFELEAIAMAEIAQTIISIGSGSHVELTGFITKRNRLSNQLVFHVSGAKVI